MADEAGGACAACGVDLPAGARFCLSCGVPTASSACAGCGEALPPTARFCSSCGRPVVGAPLSDGSGDAARPVAERRVTSILFADLVGFTPLSESLDAEDVRELLSRYFAECRLVIDRYGGTVEKFIGDAVMAVWGVPVAHEDDAERAVRAGLDLVGAIERLGPQVGAPGLAMRVGVVTGEVAVTVGATGEGMVAGDNVNTAARVQAAAEPGRVWVDDATRLLASRAIGFADVGAHTLKGKAEPMPLWRADGLLGDGGSGERVDGLHAPLTGRDSELRLLTELFHATDRARRPRLVVVDGEPGVGKSRLVSEFETYVDRLPQGVRWHRGRCLSYGEGVAYWALAEAARGRLGLLESDATSADDLDLALAGFVPDAGERDWLRPRMAALLGLGPAEGFARESLFDGWTTFFERVGGEHDSVVIVVDDAHHADKGLLDFIEHLLVAGQAPILVIVLARPDLLLEHPAIGGRRASIIHVNSLEADDMAALVDDLVDGLPTATRDRIVARSDGIPLFAVETVRALVDAGLVVPRGGRFVVADGADLDIDALGPSASLQAIIAARLDALDPEERRLVADASVLGLSFSREALLGLGSDPARLDALLAGLERREILVLQQDRFSAERGLYRFVQAMVRQVAYGTLSRRDRKARHLAVADVLQAHGEADGSDDLAVVIAQHLMDAADASSPDDTDVADLNARAGAMLVRAAERARALGATEQAWRLDLAALERTTDERRRAVLHQQAAKDGGDAGHYAESIEHGRLAVVAFDALGEPIEAGLAAAWVGRSQNASGDPEGALATAAPRLEALEGVEGAERAQMYLSNIVALGTQFGGSRLGSFPFLHRALVLAEGLADRAMIADAQFRLGVLYSVEGANETWRALTRSAIDIAAEGGHLAQQAGATMNLALDLQHHDPSAALPLLEDAVAVARRCGVASYLDWSRANVILALWLLGRLDEADRALDELESDCVDPSIMLAALGVRAWLHQARGEPIPDPPEARTSSLMDAVSRDNIDLLALQSRGELAAASALTREALPRLLEWFGIVDDFLHYWPPMVLVAVEARDVDRATALLEPVATAPAGQVTPAIRAQFLRLRGLVGALRGDDLQIVEADLRAGVDSLASMGMAGHAACARGELGAWLVRQGRADEGDPLIDQARGELLAIGATGWAERLEIRA